MPIALPSDMAAVFVEQGSAAFYGAVQRLSWQAGKGTGMFVTLAGLIGGLLAGANARDRNMQLASSGVVNSSAAIIGWVSAEGMLVAPGAVGEQLGHKITKALNPGRSVAPLASNQRSSAYAPRSSVERTTRAGEQILFSVT